MRDLNYNQPSLRPKLPVDRSSLLHKRVGIRNPEVDSVVSGRGNCVARVVSVGSWAVKLVKLRINKIKRVSLRSRHVYEIDLGSSLIRSGGLIQTSKQT